MRGLKYVMASILVLVSSTGWAREPERLTATLVGRVVDAATGEAVAARIYLQSKDGRWLHVESAAEQGSAVPYRKQRGMNSVEVHTTISAHPFTAELEPGEYTLTVERGLEYVGSSRPIQLGPGRREIDVRLRRWSKMASSGWYSGETHVHRSLSELPTAMLADDLNVALPLTYWVTRSDTPPGQGNKNSPPVKPELIQVDKTHVIYPMNTEYEIFTVQGKRHTLGAVFALNHKQVLEMGAPPVGPIARRVHGQGGLLELDKHNWPWSMMLIPVMNVDLYELTNNHIWRTEFAFKTFGESPPEYMNIERDDAGMTESGWIDFTFQNYYALLDCGYRLRVTGGTASGVHPVPLGFGRVFVQLSDGFDYQDWIKGLDAGRSFVTTGPMLTVTLNDRPHGHTFAQQDGTADYRLRGEAKSAWPIDRLEVVMTDRVVSLPIQNRELPDGGFACKIDKPLTIDRSTWLAVRCFSRTETGRPRFAHTSPYHIDAAGQRLRPRAEQVDYLVGRMEAEIARHRGVLSEAAVAEFEQALREFKGLK